MKKSVAKDRPSGVLSHDLTAAAHCASVRSAFELPA